MSVTASGFWFFPQRSSKCKEYFPFWIYLWHIFKQTSIIALIIRLVARVLIGLVVQHCGFGTWSSLPFLVHILQSSWWHRLNITHCQNFLIKRVMPKPEFILKQDSADFGVVHITPVSCTVSAIEVYLPRCFYVEFFHFESNNLEHRWHHAETTAYKVWTP